MGSCQHDFTVDKNFCCATPLPPLHLKWSRSVHVEGARHMLHSMSSLAAACVVAQAPLTMWGTAAGSAATEQLMRA